VLNSDNYRRLISFYLEEQALVSLASTAVAIENLGNHLNFKYVLNSNVENIGTLTQAVGVLEVFAVEFTHVVNSFLTI
jgi:hypothetical protein